MLRRILMFGGLLIMMGHHARSEALFYYFTSRRSNSWNPSATADRQTFCSPLSSASVAMFAGAVCWDRNTTFQRWPSWPAFIYRKNPLAIGGPGGIIAAPCKLRGARVWPAPSSG